MTQQILALSIGKELYLSLEELKKWCIPVLRLNLVHILGYFNLSGYLEKILETDIQLIPDMFVHSPFYYSYLVDNQASVDVFLKHYYKNPEEMDRLLELNEMHLKTMAQIQQMHNYNSFVEIILEDESQYKKLFISIEDTFFEEALLVQSTMLIGMCSVLMYEIKGMRCLAEISDQSLQIYEFNSAWIIHEGAAQ